MCPHIWKKVNEVFVCTRCGLTRTPDGKILFDRKITNIKLNKQKKNKQKRR